MFSDNKIEEKREGKFIVTKNFSLGSQVTLSMLSKKQDLIDFAMINSSLVKPIKYIKLDNGIPTSRRNVRKMRIYNVKLNGA